VERLSAGARADVISSDDRHLGSLSFRYFKDSLGVPGPVPDPDFIPAYGNDESSSLYDHQKDDHYAFDARYRFMSETFDEARAYAFWERKDLAYHNRYQDFFTGNQVTGTALYDKRSAGIGGHVRKTLADLHLSGGLDVLSGLIYATQTDDTETSDSVVTNYTSWSGGQEQYDVWGAGAYDLINDLRFDGSLRLQFISNRRRQPSYNVGVVYGRTRPISAKLGYGYAYRLPTLAEQFADDFYTSGNEDLAPETSRSLVGTVEYHMPGDQLMIGISVFRQDVDSLIQYRLDNTTFLSVPVNVEKFRSRGIDFSVRLKWDQFDISSSLVYQDVEQSKDDGSEFIKAFYVPDVKWRVDAGHRVSTRLHYTVGMVHTSDRYIVMYGEQEKTIRKVYEFEAHVTLDIAQSLKLIVSGVDLTDQARPDQFGFTLSDGDYPTPGRRFYVKLSAEVI
jgi:outer membrane cobalamin receptor